MTQLKDTFCQDHYIVAVTITTTPTTPYTLMATSDAYTQSVKTALDTPDGGGVVLSVTDGYLEGTGVFSVRTTSVSSAPAMIVYPGQQFPFSVYNCHQKIWVSASASVTGTMRLGVGIR